MEMRHETGWKPSFRPNLFSRWWVVFLAAKLHYRPSQIAISRGAAIQWSVLESKIERSESKVSKGSTTIDNRGVESFPEKKICGKTGWIGWIDGPDY